MRLKERRIFAVLLAILSLCYVTSESRSFSNRWRCLHYRTRRTQSGMSTDVSEGAEDETMTQKTMLRQQMRMSVVVFTIDGFVG